MLEEAGWVDIDSDEIFEEEDGKLELDFVFYNSRSKLPLHAEYVQFDLKKLSFDIKIVTTDYNLPASMATKDEYDFFPSNIMTSNTGDPEIFLTWY